MATTNTPETALEAIQDAQALADFATAHGLRPDWHEPDERGIGARIVGTHLDNAMGSTTRHETEPWSEFNVILTKEDPATSEPRDVAVVNLATLLSWATEPLR